jgi:hypothetical protein
LPFMSSTYANGFTYAHCVWRPIIGYFFPPPFFLSSPCWLQMQIFMPHFEQRRESNGIVTS